MQTTRTTLNDYPSNETQASLRSVLLTFIDDTETDAAILIGGLREIFAQKELLGKEATTGMTVI